MLNCDICLSAAAAGRVTAELRVERQEGFTFHTLLLYRTVHGIRFRQPV